MIEHVRVRANNLLPTACCRLLKLENRGMAHESVMDVTRLSRGLSSSTWYWQGRKEGRAKDDSLELTLLYLLTTPHITHTSSRTHFPVLLRSPQSKGLHPLSQVLSSKQYSIPPLPPHYTAFSSPPNIDINFQSNRNINNPSTVERSLVTSP
eukprot:756649-Hanusia_phi.AAC.12